LAELKKHNNKHQANDCIDKYANGRKTLFAWVLEDIEREPKPKHYILIPLVYGAKFT